jgi:hypothetical protein
MRARSDLRHLVCRYLPHFEGRVIGRIAIALDRCKLALSAGDIVLARKRHTACIAPCRVHIGKVSAGLGQRHDDVRLAELPMRKIRGGLDRLQQKHFARGLGGNERSELPGGVDDDPAIIRASA